MTTFSRAPRCSLAGRWFGHGLSGVCPLNGHPRCRIPRLLAGAPAVQTSRGWLRPERALVYDDHRLLLHHAAATHASSVLTAAQLAGFAKTASRLLTLLREQSWAPLLPLEFTRPEEIFFSTGSPERDALFYDMTLLAGRTQQAERLWLHTLDDTTFLQFVRC